MKIQTFTINQKPGSLNNIFRKHFRKVMAVAEEWHADTIAALRKEKIRPVKKYPVMISFYGTWKGKARRDADNILVKFCMDQMVKSGILLDDDLDHVSFVTLSGETNGTQEKLEISIIEQE